MVNARPSYFHLHLVSDATGETLTTIARKLKVSRVDLAEANNLSILSRVRVGQELIIPDSGAPQPDPAADANQPEATPTPAPRN